jgi:leucyl/phenylalanyl-tRNA--protein transferase
MSMTSHLPPLAPPPPDPHAAARRAQLFRETPRDWIERHALGVAWALKPARIAGLPRLAGLTLADLVSRRPGLPDPEQALAQPDGLAGIAHDLSVPTLLEAHRRGLYPFCHIGPMKWWSPAERCVLSFEAFHIARRLRQQMRQGQYTVTFDCDFDAVIKACAGRRPGKWHLTWVTPTIMHAYAALFDAGHAHSFEVWNEAGRLVGGGYGVAVGAAFVGESLFSTEPNTSKIGLTVFNRHLARWGFAFYDAKLMSPTLSSLGFGLIPRRAYLDRLAEATRQPGRPGRWQVEEDVRSVADWRPDRPEADRRDAARPEAARQA